MLAGEYILNNNLQTNLSTRKPEYALALYRQAAFDGKVARIIAGLSRRSNSLSDLQDLPASARGRKAHYLGLRTILLSKICGSEGRTKDFDHSFHPLDGRSKDRWLSVAIARQNGAALPPVELIKVGDTYFVRDGHHRLSVAHAFGEAYIDAEVIEW